MSKVVTGAVALVVIAGGGVGFASWSGNKVGAELQKHTADTLAPFAGVKVVDNSVVKGLFNSTHTVSLDIGCAPSAEAADGAPPFKPARITWRSTIQHGPVPGGKGLGLAHIDTVLVLPPEVQTEVTKVLGDKPPVTMHTALGFGGGYTTDITSPAFKKTIDGKANIDWQGVKATVKGDLSKGIKAGGSYAFDAPGLTVDVLVPGDPGKVTMGALNFSGTVLANDGSSALIAPSKGKGTLAGLKVTGQRPGAEGQVPFEFAIDSLEMTSDSTLDKGLVDGVGTMTAKGHFDDFAIDKIDAKVSFKRIHAATYQDMILKNFQSALKCDRPLAAARQGDEEAMMKNLATLLAYNPEYNLDRLAVTLGGKTAELSYSFATKGVTPEEAGKPLQELFMTKGYAKVAAKVEMGWIEAIVKKVSSVRKTPDQTVESLTASTMAFVNVMIDEGVSKGYAVRDGDAVKSEGSFEAGKVTVNGKPFNVPLPGGPQ